MQYKRMVNDFVNTHAMFARGLAQALGVFVLSFRCTADAEPGYGAAILKGVAQSGVWVCLEQFVSARPPTC